MICEHCGNEYVVGDWPFCPHGRSTLAVHPDDVPGGFIAENGFATPRRFYSHSEHERALAAEGCEIRAKWAGPDDKHMTRWDTVDLDAARELVSRRTRVRETEVPQDAPITVTDGASFRETDLDE